MIKPYQPEPKKCPKPLKRRIPKLNPAPKRASLPWIERLVSIDTVSRNPNLGLIETVRDELRARRHRSTITNDPRGQWANLFATVPAHDGETNGGIVLSGHTDVVPVDGQDWRAIRSSPKSAMACSTAAARAT